MLTNSNGTQVTCQSCQRRSSQFTAFVVGERTVDDWKQYCFRLKLVGGAENARL